MMSGQPRPNRAVRAVVVSNPTADRFSLLEAALIQSGFWGHLDQARRAAKLQPNNFRILIKPDLGFFEKGSATGTDPALVEHLVDLLCQREYTQVSIGEGHDS